MWQLCTLWFLCMVVNRMTAFATNVWADHIQLERRPPLPDVGHAALPKAHHLLPEIWLAVSIVMCAASGPDCMERFLQVSGVGMLLRAVVLSTTLLPTPVEETMAIYSRFDLMFSGHTVMLLSAANTPFQYAWAMSGMVLIVAARQHYTCDVLVAAIITTLLKLHHRQIVGP